MSLPGFRALWTSLWQREAIWMAETGGSSVSFPLSQGRPGQTLRIVGFAGNRGIRQRLFGLGFVKGKQIRILQKTAEGTLIVALAEDRIGLSPDMVTAIEVIPVGFP